MRLLTQPAANPSGARVPASRSPGGIGALTSGPRTSVAVRLFSSAGSGGRVPGDPLVGVTSGTGGVWLASMAFLSVGEQHGAQLGAVDERADRAAAAPRVRQLGQLVGRGVR